MLAGKRKTESSGDVKYRTGDERLVKLTSSAAMRSALLQRQGRPEGVLRVAVMGGGCSGPQYKMDLQDSPANRDILVESRACAWWTPMRCMLPAANGLPKRSGGIRFPGQQPNAATTCSCGESQRMTDAFALLEFPRQPWLEPDALKQVFLDRLTATHPDKFTDPDDKESAQVRFSELNLAHDTLRDPKRRLQHLLTLERAINRRRSTIFYLRPPIYFSKSVSF